MCLAGDQKIIYGKKWNKKDLGLFSTDVDVSSVSSDVASSAVDASAISSVVASSTLSNLSFMVIEGIVLGHKISTAALEVNQAKISMIKILMPPTTVKGIKCFLRYAGFYRRFIKDFSKISRPLCKLLEKYAKFEFDEACKFAFEEIMGVVLGQRT